MIKAILGCISNVSFQKITTAAHCIKPKLDEAPMEQLPSQQILAIFGAYKLDNSYEVERVGINPEKIFIHEDWNHRVSNLDADISLLKFDEEKLKIHQAYISPVCIWDSVDELIANEGFFFGWGTSNDSTKRHETLPKLNKLTIQYNNECLLGTPKLFEIASLRMFCASNRNGTGVCHGDAGGGLVIKIDEVYYLKGIVSFSLVNITTDNCNISNFALFTNVQKFTDWIKQKTQGAFATKGYKIETSLAFTSN